MWTLGNEGNVESVIKFPVIPTIISVLSPTLPPAMLSPCLRTISTILEVRPSPSILTRFPQIVTALSQILVSPQTPVGILDQCGELIPQLASTRTNSEILSPLTYPLIIRIYALSKSPNLTLIALPLESTLFAFSHILTADQAQFLLTPSFEAQDGVLGDDSGLSKKLKLKQGQHAINKSIPKLPLRSEDFIDTLLHLIRNPHSDVNVAAIAALTKIQYYSTNPEQKKRLSQPLLPALVPYIDKDKSDTRVFRTLAILCRDDERISTLALEAGIVQKLAGIIKTADTEKWSNSELIAECLLGLAAISLHENKLRDDVISTGVLTYILKFMLAKVDNPVSVAAFGLRKIKVASCHVIRALARSISLLRTTLTTVDIVEGIYEVLKADPKEVLDAYDRLYGPDYSDREQALEDELGIKSAVMAAVCNLIPEFSSLRSTMIDRGFLPLIVEGAYSTYPPLKLNSLWALKHAIFGLPETEKEEVVRQLTPQYLMELCNDPEPQIQEQALSFIRNFVYARNVGLADVLFSQIGMEEFLDMLEQKLVENTDPIYLDSEDDKGKHNDFSFDSMTSAGNTIAPGSRRRSTFKGRRQTWTSRASLTSALNVKLDQGSLIVISIIYILVHIATLSDDYRDLLMTKESLIKRLLPLLRHDVGEVKVACFWVVINLAYYVEPAITPITTVVNSTRSENAEDTSSPSASGPHSSQEESKASASSSSNNAGSLENILNPETDDASSQAPEHPTGNVAKLYGHMSHEDRVKERVKKLVAWGFAERIRENAQDPMLDVAQRAKEALRQLMKYSTESSVF